MEALAPAELHVPFLPRPLPSARAWSQDAFSSATPAEPASAFSSFPGLCSSSAAGTFLPPRTLRLWFRTLSPSLPASAGRPHPPSQTPGPVPGALFSSPRQLFPGHLPPAQLSAPSPPRLGRSSCCSLPQARPPWGPFLPGQASGGNDNNIPPRPALLPPRPEALFPQLSAAVSPGTGPLPPVSRPSRCPSLQAWVLPARDTESGKWCDRGSTEFLTSCFITVTAHHSGGKQVVKMASRNNCKQGDSVVYGRNAVKGETSVTRKKICDVQWPAWPSGLIMAEELCPYGEKSSQNSCGVSHGLLQLLLSRKDLLVVDKWKTGNHQLLFQFWAGRRSAEATCAILLPALAWPAACGEGNGLRVLRCECCSGL